MELPFTVVFEPPSRAELRALLRMRGHWVAGLIVALAIGAAYLLANVARADAQAASNSVVLALSSQPAGASVWIDGHQHGATPTQVGVAPGPHSVQLKAADTLDGQYSVDVGLGGSTLDAVLWHAQPSVTRLRPALPGARLVDVRLLQDGQLGLVIVLPPGREMEAWRLDPASGALEPVAQGLAASRLAFAADGHHLAFIGTEIGPPRPSSSATYPSVATLSEALWLLDERAGTTASFIGWRTPLEPGEHLAEVSWSPRADVLLVFGTQQLLDGASSTRAWFVDAQAEVAEQVLSIPSEVVPGTESWSPDGEHVTFVARAGMVNALCLLGRDGSFRYLADLDVSRDPLPGFPRATWSADGQRLLFAAPHQQPPDAAFDWLHPDVQHAIYLATLDQPTPTPLMDTSADEVTWREDGEVVGLSRAGNDSPLSIRLLNSSTGSGHTLVDLPIKPAADYGAMWNIPRADLLITSRDASPTGGNVYWLARLGQAVR